jgi:hypothetical protein
MDLTPDKSRVGIEPTESPFLKELLPSRDKLPSVAITPVLEFRLTSAQLLIALMRYATDAVALVQPTIRRRKPH